MHNFVAITTHLLIRRRRNVSPGEPAICVQFETSILRFLVPTNPTINNLFSEFLSIKRLSDG